MRCRIDFPGASGLVFTSPREVLVARSLAEVVTVLEEAERHAKAGYNAIGYVAYDAAPAFDAAFRVQPAESALPLACFAIYADAATADRGGSSVASSGDTPLALEPEMPEDAHAAAVRAIREGIAAGRFYQVNLTQRLRGTAPRDCDSLYDSLVASGNGGYAALIDAGDWWVVSVSPELLFHRSGYDIVTRPMKGTAARGRWSSEDDVHRQGLRASPKDQAENVMIVDLVRNDLGRVARAGSVRVDDLFAVETYPTVHQMTSTVSATLREGTTLADLFRALFPCGSITGAPKVAAMAAIADLEASGRGVYCGAVGMIRPGGDCTFNVAIRTLVAEPDRSTVAYGTGGGITWDSAPASEHAEMLLKARMLVAPPRHDFELLETMRLEDGTVAFVDGHLRRIGASARYFGFADPVPALRDRLEQVCRTRADGTWRVRATASRAGNIDLRVTPHARDVPDTTVALDTTAVDSSDVLLYHKTTHRATYDAAARRHPGAWDVLLINERGQVTEFTRGNLVLERAGRLLTPPLASGLLGGVLRGVLLERGEVEEAIITPENLRGAARMWFINALRGWVPVVIDTATTRTVYCVP